MKNTGSYPRVHIDRTSVPAVGQAGGLLLVETVRATGLDRALSAELAGWRKPFAVHDPGKIICDLALTLALGGDCLADLAQLRDEPGLYGRVASDPTVSRLISLLGRDAKRAVAAIGRARKIARQNAWALAGESSPARRATTADPLVVDLDATLVSAHSEKEWARPTFKKGYGFHPLCAFADHGTDGTGEPLTILLRPGNAGSNTSADHRTVIADALDQIGLGPRPGRRVLVRIDGAGATKDTIGTLTNRRVAYSVGFTLPMNTPELYRLIPENIWESAYNTDGQPRDGADVAEFTGLLDLTGCQNQAWRRRSQPRQRLGSDA